MGHLQEFNHALRNKLADACEKGGITEMPDMEAVIKWAANEVLQSYRNGVEVGEKQGSAPKAGRFGKRNAKA